MLRASQPLRLRRSGRQVCNFRPPNVSNLRPPLIDLADIYTLTMEGEGQGPLRHYRRIGIETALSYVNGAPRPKSVDVPCQAPALQLEDEH